MAVCEVRASLHLVAPWTLPPTPSATPTTTLRGALGDAIRRDPVFAPLGAWFKKPPSRLYEDSLLPRLLLRPAPCPDPTRWELRALLRGEGWEAMLPLLRGALAAAGATGLFQHGERVPFTVTRFDLAAGTVRDRVLDRLAGASGASAVLVEFVSPCDTLPARLDAVFGNLACNLVKFDRALHDDGLRSKREVDDEADAARNAARGALQSARITHESIVRGPKGERGSGETGNLIPLAGRHGCITLDGALGPALPWLALGELHGVGGHTAYGMGAMRLWWR